VVDGVNRHHAAGQLDTIYLVDVDRSPILIDVSRMPGTTAEDLTELATILESMIIER
jgi:hypothetical protein